MFDVAAPVETDEVSRMLAGAPEWPPLDEVFDALVAAGRPAPSGWLALELDLASADPGELDDAELVDAVADLGRVASWAAARQSRLLAEFARRRPADPRDVAAQGPGAVSRWAPDEIALALSVSRLAAGQRLAQARRLTETLPATLDAHEAGRIDATKVRAICDATQHLPDDEASRVQDRVLPAAERQSRAQLVAALRRAVIAVDPDAANERHAKARLDRRVVVGEETEGMASLWALLAAPDALAAHQWLTRLARGLGSEDPRGMDARRADLLVDLLTGRVTSRAAATDTGAGSADAAPLRPVDPGKPLVQVVVPHSTLIGADEQPCELVGYGPVPADLAREIAADAVWKRLVTDPLSGALLDHGRTTYRPPAALTDFVRARDVHCRSPLCRRRAVDSELDHTVPFPLGPTAAHNLTDGCPLHHREKHSPGWSVVQQPDGRPPGPPRPATATPATPTTTAPSPTSRAGHPPAETDTGPPSPGRSRGDPDDPPPF